MRLILVRPENIFIAWSEALPYVQSAMVNTPEYSVNDILSYLKGGSLSLWMFYNDTEKKAKGAMITEIIAHSRQKIMCVFLLGADDFENVVVPLFDEFIDYCKDQNIDAIECLGRFGLEHLLAPKGFRKSHVVLRKDLEYISKD